MKVLAIDLGHTIGFAYLTKVLEASETAAITGRNLTTVLASYGTVPLGQAHKIKLLCPYVDMVVIERPAYRERPSVQEQYEMEINALRALFRGTRIRTCRPADWMPRFHSYPLPGRGVLQTQHEKDAYRMAHWALEMFNRHE